jgi:anti-sigma factor RsiW
MNKDLLNILSNSNKDIDNQRLMDYVSGHLDESEAHEVERMMADNEFTDDAVEGLQQVKSAARLKMLTEQLNRDLAKKLQQKKQRTSRRRIKDEPVILFALALVLLLIIIGYVVIRMYGGR